MPTAWENCELIALNSHLCQRIGIKKIDAYDSGNNMPINMHPDYNISLQTNLPKNEIKLLSLHAF
jgi:hypothetical protein